MTAPPKAGLRRCFSTLGCTDLSFTEICELAREFAVAGLELRGMGGRMDLPEYCAENGFTQEVIAETCRRDGVELVIAGSSLKLTNASEKDRNDLLALSEWANASNIPYVRVFGGGVWGTPLSPRDFENAVALVNWWRDLRTTRRWKVELLLETHDAFSGSEPCLKLNQKLSRPLGLIWDTHHTWRIGGESPASTWEAIGAHVRHVQVKDSVDKPSARHPYTYVLPGDGQMPLAEVMALLKEKGFAGFVSLEWERHWHPYLPPLREALTRLEQKNWFAGPGARQPLVAAGTAALGVATPGPKVVGSTGQGYDWWRSSAEALLQPLTLCMQRGKADLPLKGQASNHGAQADRLESFARPCLLAAHWLASEPGKNESVSRRQVANWFREGLLIGTDPNHPERWGPTANHHQHTVEMAALTLAFQIAPKDLWEPLSKVERGQVARWLGSIRGAGLHRNNHMFFNIMTLSFLRQEGFGRSSDEPVMQHLFEVLENMALGGGWFIDGMNETVDYYQAYAFHYYGAWWAKLYGHTDHRRANRWKEWLSSFLKDYVHFFAATGENPPFGRSMCYRFAASAPFALAEHCGVTAIPPGQARRVCTRNLKFFLDHNVLQQQGALSLGWTDDFPQLTEAYSCAASPYWAAKGFAPLLLPPEHAFWKSPEQPLPSEKQDFQIAVPQAGLVVRSHEGAVEVLNNANGICVGNTKFGTWKWGKLSFRTGVGGEVALSEKEYPRDASLTAEFPDASVAGRHQSQPIAIRPEHCASIYALGDRFSQNHVTVETHLWWQGGWQLHWHQVLAYQKTRLRLGTYSLPLLEGKIDGVEISGQTGSAHDQRNSVGIQTLLGFQNITKVESDPSVRTHMMAWHSLMLLAQTGWLEGEQDLVALTWVGKPSDQRQPWVVSDSRLGRLGLKHPVLGNWTIDQANFPRIAVFKPGRPSKSLEKLLATPP